MVRMQRKRLGAMLLADGVDEGDERAGGEKGVSRRECDVTRSEEKW